MRHRSNYDQMLFLTSPMAFVQAPTQLLNIKSNTMKLLLIFIVLIYRENCIVNFHTACSETGQIQNLQVNYKRKQLPIFMIEIIDAF